ncbi:MAG: glycosyltransferase [Cyclobacteriaceae bacterium]|nr:glycosyltransferase [Cyclobacteriaceae bacterium]
MKILHISNWYPSPDAPHRALWIKDQIELMKGIADYEVWHVEVINKSPVGLKTTRLSETENSLILSFPTGRWFFIEILSFWLLVYLFFLKLSQKGFSHIHFHIAYPLLTYWCWIGHWVKKPIILSEHWSAYHHHFNVKKEGKLHRIKQIFHQPLHVVTPSTALFDDIVRFSGNGNLKGTVIPNVVDAEIFNFKQEAIRANSFFMVSQWKEPKDPFTVLEAVKDMPYVSLRIGGYGPQLHRMKDFVEQHNFSDRVVFLGTLSKKEIADEMRQATAFIHSSNYETFSVVCAEAICCGCPVLASEVGGIPEFINVENGSLVKEQSLDSWKAGLLNVKKWNKSRSEISKSALKKFQIEDSIYRLNLIYQRSYKTLM